VAQAVRQAILAEFRHDSCIASTRATLLVLHYFGHIAYPQAVKVQAFNAKAWAMRDELKGLPIEQWPPGAWSVGIAGRAGSSRPGRWDGHLVAVSGRWLLDPSLDQLARPAKGIWVEAGAFRMPEHWGAGWPEDEAGLVTQHDGSVILYEPLADTSWRQSPNWSAKLPAIKRVTGEAIRLLRAEA